MKRKFLALTLALTTLMSSSLIVNAEDVEIADAVAAATGQEVTGGSEIEIPTIKVTVPTTADIVINPFQMSVESNGETVNNQIISVPQTITNESDVAVAVNVSDLTVGTVTDGISIVTTAPTAKTTDKAAFLYLEVTKDTFADSYEKADNQLVIPKADGAKVKAASKDAIVVLDAGSDTATTAQFKIGGSVVANPTADETTPWNEADAIDLSFKFTFTPQVITN